MYGYELINFLNKNISSKNIFICSYDTLPKYKFNYPSYYVINLDESKNEGKEEIIFKL